MFEYLTSYVNANGFNFLQVTQSCINNEIGWRDEFKKELFFSRGEKNSCGVIGWYKFKIIEQTNKISDKPERTLLVEATVNDTILLLINNLKANTQFEQIETLSDLVSTLNKVKDI